MQTFLPYSNFQNTAQCLDYRRLGKQRVEAFQIINTLEKLKNSEVVNMGWVNHPAVRMWEGYETLLKIYCNEMIKEWIARGYRNNMKVYEIDYTICIEKPTWLGLEELHKSHRANLIRKLPEHYKKFGWLEEPQTGYWWPYRKNGKEWVCFLN